MRSPATPKPLERAADRALAGATPKELAAVEVTFRRLVENRIALWAIGLS